MVKRNGKRKSGTREWAEVSKNFCLGCENDCLYCYAKADAVRFGRATKDSWKDMKVIPKKFFDQPRKVAGRIMFPTTHDITPTVLDSTIGYMAGWLQQGNEMLVVSKPRADCIKAICDAFEIYKSQITFRFTIGSADSDILKFWEPNAPTYGERLIALIDTFKAGFKTSVSSEPFFDDTIIPMTEQLLPYITDTIWIGKMNNAKARLTLNCGKEEWELEKSGWRLLRVQQSQTDEKIWGIYNKFKDNPKVKWKESVKAVLGLPEEATVG